MNVLELMLNDFVECLDGSHEEKVYAQVIAIEEGQDSILVEKDHTCNWFLRPEYLEPIPLTSEILEKNGFNRFVTNYVIDGGRFKLENPSHPKDYKDNYWLRIGGIGINILYVHQLQHALRLCGLRELADNFKLEKGGEK